MNVIISNNHGLALQDIGSTERKLREEAKAEGVSHI
jgi:hypothetical protein